MSNKRPPSENTGQEVQIKLQKVGPPSNSEQLVVDSYTRSYVPLDPPHSTRARSVQKEKPRQLPVQTLDGMLKVKTREINGCENQDTFRHSWDVMAVFFALLLLSLMSSIDATIVTTALPTIAREFGNGQDYIWVINGFLFGSTATQPLFAQAVESLAVHITQRH
ncbi:hypothetical protein EAE99_006625 [Botrytis elliptica]|nr:hypothetical protein EAE99_006625 [Botrytis elliptica]